MKFKFYRRFGLLLAVMVLPFVAGSAAGTLGATSGSSHSPGAALPVVTDTLNMPVFWNGPLQSGVTMAANDQARLLPGPNDEVRLIVQLDDEPLAAYIDQSFPTSQSPNAAEAVAVRAYAAQLAESHRQVVAQLEQGGGDVKVNREFSYLVNGLAILTQLRDVARLKSLPQVKAVQPDYDVHADLGDSVPLIGAPLVWNMVDGSGQHVTGLGIRVAIIDTGIDYTHPDLGNGFGPGHRVIGGYDFVNNDGDPFDDNGHGTHVAGIVAASGVVTGVAPGASLLAYKALDAGGSGSYSNVIAALERAVDPDGNPLTDDSANVINMSLGGPGNPDDMLSQAVDQAVAQGVIVVVAAGNNGPNFESMGSPALARRAVTVAASDKTDVLASFSSRGPVRDYLGLLKPDITAPGVSIRSTVPASGRWGSPDRYNTLSGTSMAAPHIAGAAALIKQLHPAWTPDMIKANLMNTARNLGEPVYAQGAGRVQVNVAATAPLIAVPGSLSFGRPALGGVTSLPLTLTNVSTAAITATASISTVLWDNGTLNGTTVPVQVSYGQLAESNMSIPAGGTHILAVNLNVPGGAPDGYYTGQISLRGKNYTLTVPFAFTLLSKVTVHLLDEQGNEWTYSPWNWYWDYVVYLMRVPDADVQANSWSIPEDQRQVPQSFYVPSGTYNAFGFGRTMIYGNVLKNWGGPPQSPLMLAATVDVPRNADLDVYLDGRQAHRFTLDTTTFAGDPLFINQWDAGFKYQNGDRQFTARLAWGYGNFTSRELSATLPISIDWYISDTPPHVSFDFAPAGFGFTPALHHFEQLNSANWYDSGFAGVPPGISYRGWGDEVHLYAWHFPQIDSSTPTMLHYDRSEVGHYRVKYDIPGTLDTPPLPGPNYFTVGSDYILYPPLNTTPFGLWLQAGVQRDVYVRGAYRYEYWTDLDRFTLHDFFSPAGQPSPPIDDALSMGGGPLYPAIAFNNNPVAQIIQLSLPVFGSSHGNLVFWNSGPQLSLYRDDAWVYGTGFDDGGRSVPMTYTIPSAQPGSYRVLIDGTNTQPVSYHNRIEAGFKMDPSQSDVNPPRVTALDMSQRFTPHQPLTATLTFTDAESGLNTVQLRYSTDDGASWLPLTTTSDGSRYTAVIDPGDTLAVSLGFTVTDHANNYLAYTSIHAAIRETPVVFDVNASPAFVPLQSQPVTLHLNGVLRNTDNQPLSQIAYPIAVYFDDHFAGYVRDLIGQAGSAFQHGTIDADFTFIPTDFFSATGPAKMKFVLDVGTYVRQEKVLTLWVGMPHLTYLPLVMNNADVSPARELIVNGSFEEGLSAWQWNDFPIHANVVSTVVHSGVYAARLGIEPPEPLEYSYATATYPIGVLPATSHARLSFWYWPRREGLAGDPQHSRQFAYILEGGEILQKLFEYDEDLPGWQYAAFDLTPYVGRSISIQFGVYHDGNAVYDKRSALYVDDVSLLSDAAPPP